MIAVVLYAKLTPYHIARLETSGQSGQLHGHRLVGIEVADQQSNYRWPDTPQPGTHYARHTLFPGCDYVTLSYRQVRAAVNRTLENLRLRDGVDVVVLPGWGKKEALAGLGWCLRRRVPCVVVSDSQPIDHPQTIVKIWGKRLLVRRFQTGFAGGQPHVRYLVQLGLPEERCFVGCDVVDNEFFARESRRWRAQDPRPSDRGALLSCLRLLPRKNVLGVLDLLARRAPQWTWTLAGDGSQRPEVEQCIKVLGLEKRVRLLGHVNYFDLPRVYARADVYLQPSLSEPWGLAINEAMACGLPVVVSNRCGCREDLVREGENGYLFDPGEPESLAAALERMWEARGRWPAMGQASSRIIAAWGLNFFAQNFWRACKTALSPTAETLGSRALSRALSLAL